MKRKIRKIILLTVLATLLYALPVLAIATATITVTNTTATTYTMLPITTMMSNTALVTGGFISPSGLDVLVSSGSALPHMLVTDRTLFASPIAPNSTSLFYYTTGNTPLTYMYIIPGYNGYVTAADNVSTELHNNWKIAIDCYIDTTAGTGKYLVYKDDAIQCYVSPTVAGTVTVDMYDSATTITNVAGANTTALYGASVTRAGQKFTGETWEWMGSATFYLAKAGTPTGTGYAVVRNAATSAIIGTLGSIDVSTLTGAPVAYTFSGTNVNVTGVADFRVCFEYSGGDVGNNVLVYWNNAPVIDGVYSTFTSPNWTDNAGQDCTGVFIHLTGFSTSITGLASGENLIEFYQDVNWICISLNSNVTWDGVHSNRTATDTDDVNNNANIWYLFQGNVCPYIESFKLSVEIPP